MRYRIAVDTGGTFTDVVVADESGNLFVGKAPTTRERAFRGIREALEVPAAEIGVDIPSLLQSCNLFLYGTTRATNAIVEGTTAKTAFLVTQGFPDILTFREGGKLRPFDYTTEFPDPYVPRRLTYQVEERIDSEGAVLVPLDETGTRKLLGELGRRDIQAVGVCLLWSIVNPAHEEALGRLIREELPGVPYTLSHQLNPIIREYRRASSTAIDASLKPLMQTHLRQLDDDLLGAGFGGELLAATSSGGAMHVEDLVQRPVYSVRSGPAMAPVLGQTYAKAEADVGDAIVCDTGGTSFDVSLVRDGLITKTRETWLGEQFTGHLIGMSSVDVRSIGSGGGSIAWVDSGGLLRVGPHSSGADPGPACYGRGGDSPTVTDAATVLGYLNPDNFLGGRMRLDKNAAVKVIDELGRHLGEDREKAAHAVLAVANEHMVRTIQEITVNEGVDPRESLIVAGGGAAGMNIVPIARELGCSRVLVPKTSGAMSACGAQFSDIVAEFSISEFTHSANFDFARVNEGLRDLQRSVDEFASGLRSRGFQSFRDEFFVEARYAYQVWELEVPLKRGHFEDEADLEDMVEAFHDVHERVFAVKEEGQSVECVSWRARVTASLDRPPLKTFSADGASAPVAERRGAFFVEEGHIEVPVHRGERLRPGMTIEGPAVIEEPTTTVVLYPGSSAEVTEMNNYMLAIDPQA